MKTLTITDTPQLSYGALNNCANLESITICEDVLSVGAKCFAGCAAIQELSIPNVTAIPQGLFQDCTSLTYFEIGASVTTIGNEAFSNCVSLSRINSDNDGEYIIPNAITEIGEGAFRGCMKLQSMSVPFVGLSRSSTGSNALFGIIFGTDEFAGGTATMQYYSSGTYDRKTYYIPSQLKTVTVTDATALSYGALYNCSNLTEINVNSSASVHAEAFTGCVVTP